MICQKCKTEMSKIGSMLDQELNRRIAVYWCAECKKEVKLDEGE